MGYCHSSKYPHHQSDGFGPSKSMSKERSSESYAHALNDPEKSRRIRALQVGVMLLILVCFLPLDGKGPYLSLSSAVASDGALGVNKSGVWISEDTTLKNVSQNSKPTHKSSIHTLLDDDAADGVSIKKRHYSILDGKDADDPRQGGVLKAKDDIGVEARPSNIDGSQIKHLKDVLRQAEEAEGLDEVHDDDAEKSSDEMDEDMLMNLFKGIMNLGTNSSDVEGLSEDDSSDGDLWSMGSTFQPFIRQVSQLPAVKEAKSPIAKLRAVLASLKGLIGDESDVDALLETFSEVPEERVKEFENEIKYYSNDELNDRFHDNLPPNFLRPPIVSRKKIGALYRRAIKSTSGNDQGDGNHLDNDKSPPASSLLKDQTCNAVIVLGGGVRGAFAAGALLGIVEQYKTQAKELKWDVVSAGSLNVAPAVSALYLESGANGELELALHAYDFWRGLKSTSVVDCGGRGKAADENLNDVDWDTVLRWADGDSLSPDMMQSLQPAHKCDTSPWKRTLVKTVEKIEMAMTARLKKKSDKNKSNVSNEHEKRDRKLLLHVTRYHPLGLSSLVVDEFGDHNTCAKADPETNPLQKIGDGDGVASSKDNANMTMRTDNDSGPSSTPSSTRDVLIKKLMTASSIAGRFPLSMWREGEIGQRVFYHESPVLSTAWLPEIQKACMQQFPGKKNGFSGGDGIVVDVVGSSALEGDVDEGAEGKLDQMAKYSKIQKTELLGVHPEHFESQAKILLPKLHIRHVVFPHGDGFMLPHDSLNTDDVLALLSHGRLAGWQCFGNVDQGKGIVNEGKSAKLDA